MYKICNYMNKDIRKERQFSLMWTQLPIMHMTTITGNVVEGYGDKINIEECYETLVTFKKYPGNDKLIIEF